MSLTPGSCAVDSTTGAVTGTGLAVDMANAWRLAVAAMPAQSPVAPPIMAISAPFVAAFCNQMAAAILNHIAANAAVTVNVTTGTAGLQRTPNPNNPTTATLAPASLVTIGGTIA